MQSHGDYKKIIKERISKFGVVEPTDKTQLDIELKIKDGEKKIVKQQSGSKLKEMAKADIEFF